MLSCQNKGNIIIIIDQRIDVQKNIQSSVKIIILGIPIIIIIYKFPTVCHAVEPPIKLHITTITLPHLYPCSIILV